MFDFITLGLLWFFTAGISFLFYFFNRWKGGIYWFWLWNCVTIIVAFFECFVWFHWLALWGVLPIVALLWWMITKTVPKVEEKMTMTRMITKADSDLTLVVKTKLEARLIVICYLCGAISLCVHLWPW